MEYRSINKKRFQYAYNKDMRREKNVHEFEVFEKNVFAGSFHTGTLKGVTMFQVRRKHTARELKSMNLDNSLKMIQGHVVIEELSSRRNAELFILALNNEKRLRNGRIRRVFGKAKGFSKWFGKVAVIEDDGC